MPKLRCVCALNRKSRFYYDIACEVLKEMPDGKRLKVLVTGTRYGDRAKPYVRYVSKNRVEMEVLK